ncbi:MAG: SCO family protein, partial [Gammaproteobacteria bacterium]
VAHNPRPGSIDPRAVSAARDALRRIDQRSMAGLEQSGPLRDDTEVASKWSPITGSALENIVDARMIDHNGRELRFGELMDMPLMLCFFYSRCQNAGKCSTTVSRLAFLQRTMREQGLDEKARLLAITLEPDYDNPDRIRRFVQDRGLKLGTHALSGGIRASDHAEFLSAFEVPVGYSAGWVNTHAVLAVLIDTNTQSMRRYVSGDWFSEQVTEDIVALK